MNKYPEYIEIDGKRLKLNTDFRLALKCDEIFKDSSIGDYEKTLAIIYILLGEEGLENLDSTESIVRILTKYLLCGKNTDEMENSLEEPTMDFKQDAGYIKASFMSDYQIDLDKTNLHWWAFHDLLQGLTESSVINRVRMIREEPLSGKKGKERERWENAKKQVALKHEKTEKEKELDKLWEEMLKKK